MTQPSKTVVVHNYTSEPTSILAAMADSTTKITPTLSQPANEITNVELIAESPGMPAQAKATYSDKRVDGEASILILLPKFRIAMTIELAQQKKATEALQGDQKILYDYALVQQTEYALFWALMEQASVSEITALGKVAIHHPKDLQAAASAPLNTPIRLAAQKFIGSKHDVRQAVQQLKDLKKNRARARHSVTHPALSVADLLVMLREQTITVPPDILTPLKKAMTPEGVSVFV
ncbi:hypothetical protein K438DRAFT_1968142 [Mycena galopus ATCC 62051]|nr:hypothetical protein K438DRAFT_1968142 [Mycena galopus ATCC 62051]